MYINQKDWSEWYKFNSNDYYKTKIQLLHGEKCTRTTKNKSSGVCVYVCEAHIYYIVNAFSNSVFPLFFSSHYIFVCV